MEDSDVEDQSHKRNSKKHSSKKASTGTPHAKRLRDSSPILTDAESLDLSSSFLPITNTPTNNRRSARSVRTAAPPKTPSSKQTTRGKRTPAQTPRTARRAELGLDRSSLSPASEEHAALSDKENNSPIVFHRPRRLAAAAAAAANKTYLASTASGKARRTHVKPTRVLTLESGTEADENHYGFGAFTRVSKKGRRNALLMDQDYRKGERAWLGGFVRSQILGEGWEELEKGIEAGSGLR